MEMKSILLIVVALTQSLIPLYLLKAEKEIFNLIYLRDFNWTDDGERYCG